MHGDSRAPTGMRDCRGAALHGETEAETEAETKNVLFGGESVRRIADRRSNRWLYAEINRRTAAV